MKIDKVVEVYESSLVTIGEKINSNIDWNRGHGFQCVDIKIIPARDDYGLTALILYTKGEQ